MYLILRSAQIFLMMTKVGAEKWHNYLLSLLTCLCAILDTKVIFYLCLCTLIQNENDVKRFSVL